MSNKPEDPIQVELVSGPFGDLSLASPSQDQPANPEPPSQEAAPAQPTHQPVLQPTQPVDPNNNPPREVQVISNY